MVGCWHGYLSGTRCRLAYGPADATATHLSLASVKSRLVLLFWYWLTLVKKVAHTRLPERRVPELNQVLGSQPAGGVSHKPGGKLPLLSARPAVTPSTLKRAATNFAAW